MRRGALVAFIGAGLLLLAVGAFVVATRDDEGDGVEVLTVPKVTETDVISAYDLVRAAGFRVGMSTGFSAASLCVSIAREQLPPVGAPMPEGGLVTLSPGGCPLASPAVRRPMPTAVVPDFAGTRASGVVAWAERSGMFWEVRGARALTASGAPHLLDNYRVTQQSPRPGATLRPGAFVRSQGARGFRPTPITVWVRIG